MVLRTWKTIDDLGLVPESPVPLTSFSHCKFDSMLRLSANPRHRSKLSIMNDIHIDTSGTWAGFALGHFQPAGAEYEGTALKSSVAVVNKPFRFGRGC